MYSIVCTGTSIPGSYNVAKIEYTLRKNFTQLCNEPKRGSVSYPDDA